MRSVLFIIFVILLPEYVHSSCCRLPFTDGECQVNRVGPHRYLIMPDRRSGLVIESTECKINDFDSNYRKLSDAKNDCNDCPGLLILHTNSSEIFLFPEYLERILEGRTTQQRKNVVILTTSLVGAYDLDFTLFSRYYASFPVENVPSLYIDLQLPPFDSTREIQPNLHLRLPNYDEDKEGLSKISRQELINPLNTDTQIIKNVHQLPYIYHFDIEKHRHATNLCTLYDVQVSQSSLVWNILGSELTPCHSFMPTFGRNKCYATGFTRLFCSIEEDISSNDHLQLSSQLKTTHHVEHLTIAVTGGRHVDMSLSNAQMKPAEQVKILLLKGHLTVTDINLNLSIRVEYGWKCEDFGLVVPAGFSATRYRRFDAENFSIYEGNSVITLPSCFRVIPNSARPITNDRSSSSNSFPKGDPESDEESLIEFDYTEPKINDQTNSTKNNEKNFISKMWNKIINNSSLAYGAIVLLVLIILLPLCCIVFYRVYYNRQRKSNWKLEHSAHTNPGFLHSKDEKVSVLSQPYVNNSTQTIDTPIRI